VESSASLKKLAVQPYEMPRITEEAPKEASPFPKEVKCPICGTALKVPRAGKRRCPTCKTAFEFHGKGNVVLA